MPGIVLDLGYKVPPEQLLHSSGGHMLKEQQGGQHGWHGVNEWDRSAICWGAGPQPWYTGPSHSRVSGALDNQSGHFFELMRVWPAQSCFLNYKGIFGQLRAYELLCLLGLKIRPCCTVWERGQISGRTSTFMIITKAQWKSPVNEERHT